MASVVTPYHRGRPLQDVEPEESGSPARTNGMCNVCNESKVSTYEPAKRKGMCRPCFIIERDIANGPVDNEFIYRRRGPASKPTDAMPGTLEKIVVLTRRAENGEELWHPDDAKDHLEFGKRRHHGGRD